MQMKHSKGRQARDKVFPSQGFPYGRRGETKFRRKLFCLLFSPKKVGVEKLVENVQLYYAISFSLTKNMLYCFLRFTFILHYGSEGSV